jgi:hypothetical protein
MTNSSYFPIYIVRTTHDIAHFSWQFQEESRTFAVYDNDYWNTYTKSLITVPIICSVLALAVVVILNIVLCLRMCCKSFRCLPALTETEKMQRLTYISNPWYNRWALLLLITMIFAILTDQSFIYGRSELTLGVNDLDVQITSLYDITKDIANYSTVLKSYASTLTIDFNDASSLDNCSSASSLTSYTTTIGNYTSDITGVIDPVSSYLNYIISYMELYGSDYIVEAGWLFYLAIYFSAMWYVIGYFCQSVSLSLLGIGISEIIIVSFFVIMAIEMVLLVSF